METTHFDIEKQLVFGDRVEYRKVDSARYYQPAVKRLAQFRESYSSGYYQLVRVRREVLKD